MQDHCENRPAFGRVSSARSGAPGSSSLLDLDGDLGAFLSRERTELARRELRVAVVELSCGLWTPARTLPPFPHSLGILVASGFVMRTIVVGDEPSAELFGPGDLIRTWEHDPEPMPSEWQVLEPTTFGLLERSATASLGRFPEVMLMLLERVAARARRLATTQAISQMTGVDRRLDALLWHFAELWGKVRVDGVHLPLYFSHRQLAALIGARRPTVSTAVALLAEQGRISRCGDGSWLLHGAPAAASDDHLARVGAVA